MKYIIKRDGRKVPFNKRKIENAIYKAFEDVDGEVSEWAMEKASNIAKHIEEEADKSDKDGYVLSNSRKRLRIRFSHGLDIFNSCDGYRSHILWTPWIQEGCLRQNGKEEKETGKERSKKRKESRKEVHKKCQEDRAAKEPRQVPHLRRLRRLLI